MSDHQQYVISSKDSEDQEEFLCTWDKAEGQSWMCVMSGPFGQDSLLDTTAWAQEHFRNKYL